MSAALEDTRAIHGNADVRIVAGTLLALFSWPATPLSFTCPARQESALREDLQWACSKADLVALLKPRYTTEWSTGDQELHEAPVLEVWEGAPGPDDLH